MLRQLKKHRNAFPFLLPVDPVALKIPQYFEFIKNPSDLGTAEKKLQAGEYSNVDEFVDDVRRVWNNCYAFNGPEAPVSLMAKDLETMFNKQLPKMPTAPPVSDAD